MNPAKRHGKYTCVYAQILSGMRIRIAAGAAFLLFAVALFFQPFGVSEAEAKSVTTPIASIPEKTDADVVSVSVQGSSGVRTFRVFA